MILVLRIRLHRLRVAGGDKDKPKSRKDKPVGGGVGSVSSTSSDSSKSSSEDPYKKEKGLMRTKGYDSMKIPALPKNAAEARGFRNQLYSAVTKLAKGDEAPIFSWIARCQKAETPDEFSDSGNYPVLDRVLGHRLLEQAKGTKFSLDFQTIQEAAQKVGKQPKGRMLLCFVFRKFKLDKDRGTALTPHHLLSLRLQGNDIKALEEFSSEV